MRVDVTQRGAWYAVTLVFKVLQILSIVHRLCLTLTAFLITPNCWLHVFHSSLLFLRSIRTLVAFVRSVQILVTSHSCQFLGALLPPNVTDRNDNFLSWLYIWLMLLLIELLASWLIWVRIIGFRISFHEKWTILNRLFRQIDIFSIPLILNDQRVIWMFLVLNVLARNSWGQQLGFYNKFHLFYGKFNIISF